MENWEAWCIFIPDMREDFSFSLSRTNLGVIMKRIVAVFLLFLMVLTSVFALSNSQKIYRVDSKEYEDMQDGLHGRLIYQR